MKLDTKLSLAQIIASDNCTEYFTESELNNLGAEVVRSYEMDKASRHGWEKRTEEALKLALQVVEAKSFPWPNASNIKFPLITIAALQYHARAYPALIPDTSVVKCRVIGTDKTGEANARAARIETHMSYQVLEEDEAWEDQMDKVLITQPIVGCAFKKTYYDGTKKHNISENILARDLVVSYYTKTLDTAPRISHVLYLSNNDIYERKARGIFRDVDLDETVVLPQQDGLTNASNKAQGVDPAQQDNSRPDEFIEQHCFLDLDQDGYEEPYIVVVHKHSRKVMRIVARFFQSNVEFNDAKASKVVSIKAENYFTKYPFIPSPDGGFYDLGFGALLGPLNDSINTLVNQLVDSGTMSNTAGGFLSRGIKIRGGNMSFSPNEWKPVDTTGDDLRKGIMPLPVREPSQVLFSLLSMLINYGERIAGSTDIMVGENPGQNTPAETSRNMTEQGMKVFTGIFKRTYRSLKQELRKLYRLNQLYMEDSLTFGDITITPKDYSEDVNNIVPAADPHMVSDAQKVNQTNMLYTMSKETSGWNQYEVKKRILESWKVQDIESVLPDPKGPNAIQEAPHFKVQEAQVKVQGKMKEIEAKVQMHIASLDQEAGLVAAKITKLEAESIAVLEQSDSVAAGHQIAMLSVQLGAAKQHQEGVMRSLELMHKMKDDYEVNKLEAKKIGDFPNGPNGA